MSGLLIELRSEHKSIAEVLGCLDHQIKRFENGQQPDFDVLRAALDYFEGFPERCHHPKEDLIFRRLSQRDEASARSIGDLAQAHLELADNLRTFSKAVRGVLGEAELPRDAVVGWARDFIDRQRNHLLMEETSFFPAAERALSEEDWRDLAVAVPRDPEPLRGISAESKYEALRSTILQWDIEDRQSDPSDRGGD